MTVQVIPIGEPPEESDNELSWFFGDTEYQIDSALLEGSAPGYLENVRILLGATVSPISFRPVSLDLVSGVGDMTSAWEEYASAFTISAGGLTYTAPGPNASGLLVASDPSRPYFWTPNDQATREAFFNAYRALSAAGKATTTLTLDDGVPISPARAGEGEPLEAGSAIAEAGGTRGTEDGDVTSPMLVTATFSGDQVTLTYDEPLDEDNAPSVNDFFLLRNNNTWDISSVSLSGAVITITTASAASQDAAVDCWYFGSSTRDLNGNLAASFNNEEVTSLAPPRAGEGEPLEAGSAIAEAGGARGTAAARAGEGEPLEAGSAIAEAGGARGTAAARAGEGEPLEAGSAIAEAGGARGTAAARAGEGEPLEADSAIAEAGGARGTAAARAGEGEPLEAGSAIAEAGGARGGATARAGEGEPLEADSAIAEAGGARGTAAARAGEGEPLEADSAIAEAGGARGTAAARAGEGEPLEAGSAIAEAGGARRLANIPAADQWRKAEAMRLSAKGRRYALEISHYLLPDPIRVVKNTQDVIIEGNNYQHLAFNLMLPNDEENEIGEFLLDIDNVGEALTQWIEASRGGLGATVRIMEVMNVANAGWEITYETSLSSGSIVSLTNLSLQITLIDDPLAGLPAIRWRHDRERSPGLH